MVVAYTYLIGWKELDVWYYGVRYARGCNVGELWKTYFTSSKHVSSFCQENGAPNVIQIRKTFDDIDSARKWENKVLKRMNVVNRANFLNKTDNISIDPSSSRHFGDDNWMRNQNWNVAAGGRKHPRLDKLHTSESKKRISESLKGSNNPNFGKNQSEEHKHKRSISMIGKNLGKTRTEEQKLKLKNRKSAYSMGYVRPKEECVYCHVMVDAPNMTRWHGDKCKHNYNKISVKG